jgi:hypothetical protein
MTIADVDLLKGSRVHTILHMTQHPVVTMASFWRASIVVTPKGRSHVTKGVIHWFKTYSKRCQKYFPRQDPATGWAEE